MGQIRLHVPEARRADGGQVRGRGDSAEPRRSGVLPTDVRPVHASDPERHRAGGVGGCGPDREEVGAGEGLLRAVPGAHRSGEGRALPHRRVQAPGHRQEARDRWRRIGFRRILRVGQEGSWIGSAHRACRVHAGRGAGGTVFQRVRVRAAQRSGGHADEPARGAELRELLPDQRHPRMRRRAQGRRRRHARRDVPRGRRGRPRGKAPGAPRPPRHGRRVRKGRSRIRHRPLQLGRHHPTNTQHLQRRRSMSNTALPLISVVVPVYNVKPYVAKCLDSILRQTYTNIEIIVVDDGSTDGSELICDDYSNKDPRITVIHQRNTGLAAARNTGIDAAHGEYLGFVDSDDFIEPFMYEKLLNAAQKNNCVLAVCGINYVFDNGTVIPKANIEPDRVFDFPDAITEMNTYRLFDMGAWSKLYKSELFDGIRFPVGKLSEDFFIMFKIFDRAQKVAFVSDACYNYYQRTNSITKSKKINHDFLEAAYKQMRYIDRNYPSLSVIGHTAYASAALTVYDSYLKNQVPCPEAFRKQCISIIQNQKQYIAQANYISKAKRIQFHLFLINATLYKVIFMTYKIRNKI